MVTATKARTAGDGACRRPRVVVALGGDALPRRGALDLASIVASTVFVQAENRLHTIKAVLVATSGA